MSESLEFDAPERFTAATVGEPGRRVFLLQAEQAGRRLTLKLEKQQVAALCEYLAGILADLPAVDASDAAADLDLHEPAEPAWVVGSLAVAYEQAEDRILLVAEELIVVEDEDELAAMLADPATARFLLRRDQVRAFIDHGLGLVRSGRPTCRLCLRPMDPDGHVCPRLN